MQRVARLLGKKSVSENFTRLQTSFQLYRGTSAVSGKDGGLNEFSHNIGEVGPWGKWGVLATAGGAALWGTTLAFNERHNILPQAASDSQPCMSVNWVQQLAAEEDSELVLSAATMHAHPLLKNDHMFSALHKNQMVEDLVCFYSPSQQSLQYVIQLGKNICGFPSIMHGGLTAAIVDESFGFMWLSLRANDQLPFRGPAFTAHLEVDYKKKIPAGRLLLCKIEVESCEGRKLWMKATVTDGPSGTVYATARALFVRPKTQKLLQDGIKIAVSFLTG